MRMFAYCRRVLAGSTAVTALALAAFAASPALSADLYENGRYGERSYEVPVPVYPQAVYERERPREYRVVIYPEKRHRGYEYDYERESYRAPVYPPAHSSGYYNGNGYPNGYGNGYASNGNGGAYEQGYRDGVADASGRNGAYGRAESYGRAEYEGGVLLPPAPVGPPRRAPIVYAPAY